MKWFFPIFYVFTSGIILMAMLGIFSIVLNAIKGKGSLRRRYVFGTFVYLIGQVAFIVFCIWRDLNNYVFNEVPLSIVNYIG